MERTDGSTDRLTSLMRNEGPSDLSAYAAWLNACV